MIFGAATFAQVPFAAKLGQLETVLPPPEDGGGLRRVGESLPDDPLRLPALPESMLYIDFRRRPGATTSELRVVMEGDK